MGSNPPVEHVAWSRVEDSWDVLSSFMNLGMNHSEELQEPKGTGLQCSEESADKGYHDGIINGDAK